MGLGGTVDYEIELSEETVNKLISEWQINSHELDTEIEISSQRDVLIVMLAFIKNGSGGERFVQKSEDLINFAMRFDKKITLGGTCVRAALALEPFDISSVLHLVSMSPEVRYLLPKNVTYICSAHKDSLDPHLIIQYPEGFKCHLGAEIISSPQPSRIIFTNDPPNRELLISDDLGEKLKNASVFMISGFNCIQDEKTINKRIDDIEKHLKQLPKDSIIYFEDAGYHIPSMSKVVHERLNKHFDVYGMNEDEMQNYLNRKIDLLNPIEVNRGIIDLKEIIEARNLVIHTRYWSIAYGPDSNYLKKSIQAGINMASTRFKFGDNFSVDNYEEISNSTQSELGSTFANRINEIFGDSGICVPGYDLNVPKPSTIGLGDAFVGGFVGSLFKEI